MIQYLGFGDSWAFGDELNKPQEQPYINLISDTALNYARPGTSIPQLVIQLRKFIAEDYQPNTKYRAVFFLTAQERFFTYYNGADYAFNPRGVFHLTSNVNDLNTQYYKYFYSDEFANYTANTTILTLQSICRHYNIEDYYLPGWQTFEWWPEVNQTRIYPETCQTILEAEIDTFGQVADNPYFTNPGCHPNYLGHQKIAQTLSKFLTISEI